MRFGEALRKVRTQEKDSLRGLASKTGIYFTYIDKIERSQKPVNTEILEKLVKQYHSYRRELIEAYVEEVVPSFVLEEIKNPPKNNITPIIKELDKILFEEFSFNEQKDILKTVVEKLEILSFRRGTLEKDKDKLDKVKDKIDKL